MVSGYLPKNVGEFWRDSYSDIFTYLRKRDRETQSGSVGLMILGKMRYYFRLRTVY